MYKISINIQNCFIIQFSINEAYISHGYIKSHEQSITAAIVVGKDISLAVQLKQIYLCKNVIDDRCLHYFSAGYYKHQ